MVNTPPKKNRFQSIFDHFKAAHDPSVSRDPEQHELMMPSSGPASTDLQKDLPKEYQAETGDHMMLKSIYSTKCSIQGTNSRIRLIITDALNGLGYSGVKVNAVSNHAYAVKEEGQQIRKYKLHYQFHVNIGWQKETTAENWQVTISVSERNRLNMEFRCHQLSMEIIERLTESVPCDRERMPTGWATEQELSAMNLLHRLDLSTPEEEGGLRFLVGQAAGFHVALPERNLHQHVLVCGPTGCGKTRGIFTPNLTRRLNSSAIVTEATVGAAKLPTLYAATKEQRGSDGRAVFYFNPSDPRSVLFNPVDFVQDFSSAKRVASLILANTELRSDGRAHQDPNPFFERLNLHLLTILLWYAATRRRPGTRQSQPGDGANLGFIRELAAQSPYEIGALLQECSQPIIIKEFESYCSNNTDTVMKDGLAGVRGRLDLWVDPQVAALTEVTGFDISALAQEVFTFYFATDVLDRERKPLAATALGCLLHELLTGALVHPLTLYLDEFTNFGHIPDMPIYVSIVRNRGIGMVFGIQSTHQLTHTYGAEAEMFLSMPATRIFFRPNEFQTADQISKSLGMTEKVTIGNQGDIRTEYVTLLDAAEFMRLARDEIVVFLPQCSPIKLKSLVPECSPPSAV